MKKKLEAELISIAHRILKLRNRSELDQLQSETLKLYEKISVLRFVEDNFADVKPTIGYASAEGKLEDIYGIEDVPEVHANEVEAAEDKARAEKKEQEKKEPETKKEDSKIGEAKPEGDADPEQKVEEYQASEEEKEHTEEETDESPLATEKSVEGGKKEEEPETDEELKPVEAPSKEEKPEIKEPKEEKKEEAPEEPEQKVEVVKPEAEVKSMEEGAAAVFEKEDDSTIAEEEKAADAEVVTIAPDASAKTENSGLNFDFAFERTPAPEVPQKQKEISFEDFHDYKEPEFIKKDDKKIEPKAEEAKKEEAKAEDDDWRNWEPNKNSQSQPAEEKKEAPEVEAPKAEESDWRNWEPKKEAQPEAQKEEPKQQETTAPPAATPAPAASRPLNDAFGKTITLGLNDRIAFEKNLFAGSSEDLNRVVSQINTQNSFDEAKAFIEDLVKPDYNNWAGKEDYETRFMELVEKRFS